MISALGLCGGSHRRQDDAQYYIAHTCHLYIRSGPAFSAFASAVYQWVSAHVRPVLYSPVIGILKLKCCPAC